MIETLLYDRVETIEPQGYVNAANASDFLEQLKWTIESKQDCVFLVDMKEVEFLDSAGYLFDPAISTHDFRTNSTRYSL
jgi:anti-sigma B factor antagonist